jgi:DNA-binding protein H-NS
MEITEQVLRRWAEEFKKIVPPEDILRRGASIVQPMKRFEAHVIKKPRKEQEAEYERFNQSMNELLKVPPQVVKDAIAAEKRHREEEAQRTGKRGRGRPPKR